MGPFQRARSRRKRGGRALNGSSPSPRKEVLLQLEHRLMEGKDQRVFSLNGLAGMGKSAIAQTFAEMSFADGRLGASFFCSQDYGNKQTTDQKLVRIKPTA